MAYAKKNMSKPWRFQFLVSSISVPVLVSDVQVKHIMVTLFSSVPPGWMAARPEHAAGDEQPSGNIHRSFQWAPGVKLLLPLGVPAGPKTMAISLWL